MYGVMFVVMCALGLARFFLRRGVHFASIYQARAFLSSSAHQHLLTGLGEGSGPELLKSAK